MVRNSTAVKKGGKLLTFSALVAAGNGKGALSIGKGKHKEAVKAIDNVSFLSLFAPFVLNTHTRAYMSLK